MIFATSLPFRVRPIALLAALLLAPPLAAQQAGRPDDLAARMRAFLDAAPEAPNDSVAAFFPRHGDWTWVQTSHHHQRRGRSERIGVWRFSGAETLRAIREGGPVCASFDVGGGVGPYEGRFGMQTLMHRGPWRRVRGTRFVPAGEAADSPVFVEWRREDGAWVVSAFGDLDVYFPPVLGRLAGPFSRDTTASAEDAAFAPADWYMITLNGQRYPQYGRPRPLDRERLVRIGVYQSVSVFADREENPERPYVVYLSTAPGQVQAYQSPHGPYVCH